MKFSVIIAVEEVNAFVRENIARLLETNFQDFEILLMLSKPTVESFPKTEVIVRSDLAFNPAKRRDLAIDLAHGEILAFIDDDAYPSPKWLSSAVDYFSDPAITAVGGPGVTPPSDSLRQKVSGWVSASPFGGGPLVTHRFLPEKRREVGDFPSMNLLVRKSDFAMIGGFDSSFWPGEDTKLCLDLTTKIGKRIIYDPEVLVYHHRRAIFGPHLKQNGRYGFYRGYFARRLPKTSRKIFYFLPSLWLVFLILTPLVIGTLRISSNFSGSLPPALNFRSVSYFYFLILNFYFLLLIANAVWIWRRSGDYRLAFLSLPTVFLTHLWYGFQFLKGFFSADLHR